MGSFNFPHPINNTFSRLLGNCRTLIVKIALILILAVSFAPPTIGQPKDLSKLTAAFIYRISQFVSWPDDSFSNEGGELNLCVEGKDPIDIALSLENRLARTKQQKNKLMVKRLSKQASLEESTVANVCHVLVITSENWLVPDWFNKHNSANKLLLIGNSLEFLQDGGMLSLILKKGRMAIYINREVIDKSHLKFDSRLLSLAREK